MTAIVWTTWVASFALGLAAFLFGVFKYLNKRGHPKANVVKKTMRWTACFVVLTYLVGLVFVALGTRQRLEDLAHRLALLESIRDQDIRSADIRRIHGIECEGFLGPLPKSSASTQEATEVITGLQSTVANAAASGLNPKETVLGRASLAYARGEYGTVLRLVAPVKIGTFLEAEASDIEKIAVLRICGDAQHGLKEWQKAFDYYEAILGLRPFDWPTCLKLANCLASLSEISAALIEFDRIVDYFSNEVVDQDKQAVTLSHRAGLHRLNDDDQSAMKDITESIRILPAPSQGRAEDGDALNSLIESYYLRASMYVERHEFAKAYRDLRAAVGLTRPDPDDGSREALDNLAHSIACTLNAKDDFDNSIAFLDHLASRDPGNQSHLRVLAYTLHGRARKSMGEGAWDRAEAEFTRAITIRELLVSKIKTREGQEKLSSALFDRSQLFYFQGEFTRAILDVEASLALLEQIDGEPLDVASRYVRLGMIFATQGEFDSAMIQLSSCTTICRSVKVSDESSLLLAEALRGQSRVMLRRNASGRVMETGETAAGLADGAVKLVESVVRNGNDEHQLDLADALESRAESHTAARSYGNAIDDYSRAIELRESHTRGATRRESYQLAHTRTALARVYFLFDKPERALTEAQKSVSEFGDQDESTPRMAKAWLAEALCARAHARPQPNELPEALQDVEEAIEIRQHILDGSEDKNHWLPLAVEYLHQGAVLHALGRYTDARVGYEKARDILVPEYNRRPTPPVLDLIRKTAKELSRLREHAKKDDS